MVDFTQELRHRCRNPKCRTKLKMPVENEHHAFCARGCHGSFYLKRCLVCEERLPEKSRRQVCNRPKCKAAYRAAPGRYKWPPMALGSGSCKVDAKSARKSGLKTAHKYGRAWHLVAGPKPTDSQFHCATVPDGPDCQWEGGEYRRIESRNRARLQKHFAEQAAKCLIQPHHPPINILGGYRFPDAPDIGTAGAAAAGTMTLDEQTRLAGLLKQIPQDLSIPSFLRRTA